MTSNPLLTGPILPTLLRLALPNVLALMMGVLVSIAETVYIGRLGVVPLAAMALVLPFGMLPQMLSSGAMGGGVSSAVARALGAQDLGRAQALALHALAIGGVAGLGHAAIMIGLGPWFFRLLGGSGDVLAAAIAFSTVLFCGTPFIWLMNAMLSVVRGTGNMKLPSRIILGASVLQIAVGGSLGLGLGPLPRWGLPGVALGTIVGYGCGALFLFVYLTRGAGRLRLPLRGVRLRWPLFADILKVGAVSCLSPLQSVVTMMVITSLIARFDTQTLAGYGIGQRLEFLLIPVAFGIGVAAMPMVGMAIGAGEVARARRVAWTAGAVSGVNLLLIGSVIALYPGLWANLFSDDPQVLAAAGDYLRWAGPAFGLFGAAYTLYFASQGSGRVIGPVLAATGRLVLVVVAGQWLLGITTQVWPYFALVSGAMVVYAILCALAVKLTRWD